MKKYPCSYNQIQMWTHDQFYPDSKNYNTAACVHITTPTNLALLQKSLEIIFQRHEILRTTYKEENGKLFQYIHENAQLPCEFINVSTLSFNKVRSIAIEHVQQPFNLEQNFVMRVYFYTHAPNSTILSINFHHLAWDGWSLGVFFTELRTIYTALKANEPIPLVPLQMQYKDLTDWQERFIVAEMGKTQRNFWEKIIKNMQLITWPLLRQPIGTQRNFQGNNIEFRIQLSPVQHFLRRLEKEKISTHVYFLTLYFIILHKYTQEENLSINVPTPGRLRADPHRHRSDFSDNMGYFINPTIVHIHINPAMTFIDLLRNVRNLTAEIRKHQDYPLTTLLEEFQMKLPEVGFNFLRKRPGIDDQDYLSLLFSSNENQAIKIGDLQMQGVHLPQQEKLFDLNLMMVETEKNINVVLNFRDDVLNKEMAERFVGHFHVLMEQLAALPEAPIRNCSLLTPSEKQQLLIDYNQTARSFPHNQTIYQMFEQCAITMPESPALIFENKILTFAELNQRANQLAHLLLKQGVQPDSLVPICMERSFELVIGLLAILKAGGAYVPLDPSYPKDRLRFMLEDSQASFLLTQQNLSSLWENYSVDIICIDGKKEKILLAQQEVTNLLPLAKANNLAYVIYTSGSTGNPKGVMIEHRSVVNHMEWMWKTFGFTTHDRILQKTPYSFDASVWELLLPLMKGAVLVIAKPGVEKDFYALLEELIRHKITTLQMVPTLLQLFLQMVGDKIPDIPLRKLFCGGEALTVQLQKLCFHYLNVNLYNLYGPTEATIDTLYWSCTPNSHSIPIGIPVDNTQVFILDPHLKPVPKGFSGELYIGGIPLARGYWHRPDLTNASFISNPFSNNPQEKLYKTNDIVRYRPDGAIEYIGRNDQQVKLHGYRVELNEIELCLQQYPAIQTAIVVPVQSNMQSSRLVAFIVSKSKAPLSNKDIRDYLLTKLPATMVPSFYLMMDKIPLLPNGKVDKKHLSLLAKQQLQSGLLESDETYVAPKTETERQLANIWAQLLQFPQVGVEDNFFHLGGDSIIAIQMITLARQHGIYLTIKQLMATPTIASLAKAAYNNAKITTQYTLPTIKYGEDVPLTPIQHWFFEKTLISSKNTYLIQGFPLLKLKRNIDFLLFEQALYVLVEQHDALRLRFRKHGNNWVQYQTKQLNQDKICHFFDLTKISVPQENVPLKMVPYITELQKQLNFEQGCVFRVAIFDTADGQYLFFIIHHLVIDAVSLRILLEDLQIIYQQIEKTGQAQATSLLKTTSYVEWAIALQAFAQSEQLTKELAYWARPVPSECLTLPLPKDKVTASNNNQINPITIELNSTTTQQLLRDMPKILDTKIDEVLLTALVLTIGTLINNKPSLYCSIENHGREDIIDGKDLTRTIGWFTSIYPVHLHISNPNDLSTALKMIKKQLQEVPYHGVGYGILKYLGASEEAKLLREKPTPPIVFNYLGQLDNTAKNYDLFTFCPQLEGHSYNLDILKEIFEIYVGASIINNTLSIIWVYNPQLYCENMINQLAQNYKNNLEKLIKHCLQANAKNAFYLNKKLDNTNEPLEVNLVNGVIRAKL